MQVSKKLQKQKSSKITNNSINQKNNSLINNQNDDNESLTTLELSLNLEEQTSTHDNNKFESPIKLKNYDISHNEKLSKTNSNNLNIYKDFGNINSNNENRFLARKKYIKMYSPFDNRKKKEKLSDRFIPLNKGLNLMEKFNLTTYSNKSRDNSNISSNNLNNKKDLFNQILRKNIIKDEENYFYGKRINYENNFTKNNRLIIKEKIFSWKQEYLNTSKENYLDLNRIIPKEESKSITKNDISTKPYKELSVGKLLDDFYLNLLDWSSKNIIAVGCTYSVLIWNNNNSQSSKLFEYSSLDKYVSGLIWNEAGDKLAVGNSSGTVEIYDINRSELISSFNIHRERVGVVAWNGNIISSGSKDCTIINKDIRCKNTISKFMGHKQEICGLKWSFDGSQLASGSNDNLLMVWNLHSSKPVMTKNEHVAAVKALAWSPHKHNILATGGGTADKSIRMWNTTTYEEILKYDTGSQVCNLLFSRTSNELVSTHGYSLNQINIWKLPNMKKIRTLIGHNFRVLYLSLSPDGPSIVTGAGEKTIKFWNVFPPKKEGSFNNLFPSSRDYR